MKTEEFCRICNHFKESHTFRIGDWPEQLNGICWDCNAGKFSKYHPFRLDNLKLIEDTAKHKGLI